MKRSVTCQYSSPYLSRMFRFRQGDGHSDGLSVRGRELIRPYEGNDQAQTQSIPDGRSMVIGKAMFSSS